LPSNFSLLIVGASRSGKTTLLIKFLLQKKLVNYDKLYIFAKSSYQCEYKVLIAGFENKLNKNNMLKLLNAGDEIKDEKHWQQRSSDDIPTIESVAAAMGTLQKKTSKLEAEFHTSSDAIPDPADLDKSIKYLMVFVRYYGR